MRGALLSSWLFMLALGLSGCITVQEEGPEARHFALQPSLVMRFEDVPVPEEFKIIPDKSFILESGGVRAGVLKYIGKADAEDIVLFYKTQMPAHGWILMSVVEYGERILNFERENEGCVVSIIQKTSQVEITISLAPKSPVSHEGLAVQGEEPQAAAPLTEPEAQPEAEPGAEDFK